MGLQDKRIDGTDLSTAAIASRKTWSTPRVIVGQLRRVQTSTPTSFIPPYDHKHVGTTEWGS